MFKMNKKNIHCKKKTVKSLSAKFPDGYRQIPVNGYLL